MDHEMNSKNHNQITLAKKKNQLCHFCKTPKTKPSHPNSKKNLSKYPPQ